MVIRGVSAVVRGTTWIWPWNAVEVHGYCCGAPPRIQIMCTSLLIPRVGRNRKHERPTRAHDHRPIIFSLRVPSARPMLRYRCTIFVMTRFSLEEPCTYATQNYCIQRKMEREEDDGDDRAAAGGAFVITVSAKPEKKSTCKRRVRRGVSLTFTREPSCISNKRARLWVFCSSMSFEV